MLKFEVEKKYLRSIQCFECKGFGYRASECSNRKVKKYGRVDDAHIIHFLTPPVPSILLSWRVLHMAHLKMFFYYGDKVLDDELDWNEKYKITLKESMKMTRLFEKVSLKWKSTQEENLSLKEELEKALAKVRLLED